MKRATIAIVGVLLLVSIYGVIESFEPSFDVMSQQIAVGDRLRSFRIVVPHHIKHPCVVFAFHGAGDTPETMAKYSQLDQLAASKGFLLIYPTSLNETWSLESPSQSLNPDIQFFDQLQQHVVERFNVEKRRMYLVGMSDGASFAQQLVMSHGASIAAIVSHSSPRQLSDSSSSSDVPILVIIGDQDPQVSTGRIDAEKHRLAGQPIEYLEVVNLGHAWATTLNDRI